LFADTMGDLDHVRGSLTRTLNQLEMVGHARRIVGGRDSPERAEQSLSDVLAELARHQLADRARRRQVNLRLPTDGGVTITADSVLLQLALQRLLNAFVDLGTHAGPDRDASVPATAHPHLLHPRRPGPIAPDLLERGAAVVPGQPTPGACDAIGLAAKLATLLGGVLRRAEPRQCGGVVCLVLPVARGGPGTAGRVARRQM
jgi:hypothetical protein